MDDAHEPTNRLYFHRLELSVHMRLLHNWTFVDQIQSTVYKHDTSGQIAITMD